MLIYYVNTLSFCQQLHQVSTSLSMKALLWTCPAPTPPSILLTLTPPKTCGFQWTRPLSRWPTHYRRSLNPLSLQLPSPGSYHARGCQNPSTWSLLSLQHSPFARTPPCRCTGLAWRTGMLYWGCSMVKMALLWLKGWYLISYGTVCTYLHLFTDTADATERHNFLGFASFLAQLGPHPFLPELLGVVSLRAPLVTVVEELENRDLLSLLWRCRQVCLGILYSDFLYSTQMFRCLCLNLQNPERDLPLLNSKHSIQLRCKID